MKVVLVHGFNVRDPMHSVGRLIPFFEEHGVRTYVFGYGWWGILGVIFGNDNLAETLRSLCIALAEGGEEVVLIGHSNGCALIHRTAWLCDEMGDRNPSFRHVVYLSPALERDAVLAPQIAGCEVHYTKHDWAVRVARLFWFAGWGDMGAKGPSSDDRRYHLRDDSDVVKGHSDYFTAHGLRYLKDRVIEPLVRAFCRWRSP